MSLCQVISVTIPVKEVLSPSIINRRERSGRGAKHERSEVCGRAKPWSQLSLLGLGLKLGFRGWSDGDKKEVKMSQDEAAEVDERNRFAEKYTVERVLKKPGSEVV